MRTVQRNKRNVWYAVYYGEQEVLDDDGNYTGETEIVYGNPVKIRANVSPATGVASTEMFGNFADYNKVVVTDQVEIPINENSILWIDTQPIEGHGIEGYNYVVRRVARSFNSVAIAVEDVDVTAWQSGDVTLDYLADSENKLVEDADNLLVVARSAGVA